MLYDTHYNGILSNTSSILHPHSSQNLEIRGSVGKSLDVISSEVRLNANYSRISSIVLNQGIISPYSSENYYVSGYFTTDINSVMIVNYNGNYMQSRTTVNKNSLDPMHYITQSLNTSFIPKNGLIFNIGFNHYYNNAIQSSAKSSWFGNVGIKYKLKDVDFMLDWTNIFNTNQFTTYSYNDVSSYYSNYTLRPSEVLLRMRFKIF